MSEWRAFDYLNADGVEDTSVQRGDVYDPFNRLSFDAYDDEHAELWCQHLNALEAENAALKASNEELEQLFEMQHKREMEIINRWRDEGKVPPLTLPDYGHTIEMLFQEIEALEAKAALAEDAYGWVEWVHTASGSIQIQRMTTEWLARYDALTKEAKIRGEG